MDCQNKINKDIQEFYKKFLRAQVKRLVEKLGVVYTPPEIVDFINTSVNDILKKEFGVTLGTKGVKILDPFTGQGIFLDRMIRNKCLITDQELLYKVEHEIQGNEIIPLSALIAQENITEAVEERLPNTKVDTSHIVKIKDTFKE